MRITLLAASLGMCAAAQGLTDVPDVIRVVRNGFIQPYVSGKAQVNVVGMTAISGFAEKWLIEMHDSFGSLEDLDNALSGLASNGTAPAPIPQPSSPHLPFDDIL